MERPEQSQYPEFVYDEETRAVQLNHDGTSTIIYTDVTPEEFELIEAVDALSNDCGALVEATLSDSDILQNISVDRISSLQAEAIDCYERCVTYQERASDSESEVVSAQLTMLYRIEKVLKHYFRILSAAQSLAFSRSLSLAYMQNRRHLDLYVYVRNVCSTTEYLGAMIVNRLGDGSIDTTNSGENWRSVYETLRAQELAQPLIEDEEMEVKIPPSGRTKTLDELPLSANELKYLNEKRNDIVHHCPLFVPTDDLDVLPDDLVNNRIITESDLVRLCEFASRLHLHSTLMFVNFVKSYLVLLLEEFVELIYAERE